MHGNEVLCPSLVLRIHLDPSRGREVGSTAAPRPIPVLTTTHTHGYTEADTEVEAILGTSGRAHPVPRGCLAPCPPPPRPSLPSFLRRHLPGAPVPGAVGGPTPLTSRDLPDKHPYCVGDAALQRTQASAQVILMGIRSSTPNPGLLRLWSLSRVNLWAEARLAMLTLLPGTTLGSWGT